MLGIDQLDQQLSLRRARVNVIQEEPFRNRIGYRLKVSDDKIDVVQSTAAEREPVRANDGGYSSRF